MAKKKQNKKSKCCEELSAHSQIINIVVLDMMAKKSLRDGPLPSITELSMKLEAKYDSESKVLAFEPKLQVAARYEDSAANETPVLIAVTFQAIYHTPSTITKIAERELLEFSASCGIYHVWPYFRELVHDTTKRMGLPALTIPLFNDELMSIAKEERKRNRKKKTPAKKKTKRAVKR